MDFNIQLLNQQIQKESAFVEDILAELRKVIVGQDIMIRRLLTGLLADGHILLEGVPGLAKTLTVNSLALSIKTLFHRIQFTPDLLPADLIGTLIYNQKTSGFEVKKGPIFANIILADEINRSPAKVQSALLEAMQERQVTIGDNTYRLEEPFLVLATQNPIEQEGTYPLPEAQVDRFMLKIRVTYPSKEEEMKILNLMTGAQLPKRVKAVVTPEQIIQAREVIRGIYVDEKIHKYVTDLVFATRYPEEYGLDNLKPLIDFGASPRASINLVNAAKANAFLDHRGYVTPEDIRELGADVLRHRIIPSFEAEAEEITVEDMIRNIFEVIPVP
ncbi:TPA: ATPase [Candidatus Marinimicrobia bacterium]|nr:MAG: ATPase associated with various cellular activities AAA_3 [Marinimicrobia bacterium 46_47]KUK93864.1 MAG: ATPase associated with various cellular activities AAA_3 [Marinimicrobia bacterium 46_43]HAE86561.1 ATPase [Candidatus Neomarinimicrobiota bacterium]HBY18651.1 ATPase [Candidatus Neomarinimicrobiota bacterium]